MITGSVPGWIKFLSDLVYIHGVEGFADDFVDSKLLQIP